MSTLTPPCVLSIAGTDPSGGAGIHADIKTISATGSYAAAVITALVAQNTQHVDAIFDLTPEFLSQQLHSVFSDLDIKAVKLGMLHNKAVIKTVTDNLKNYKGFIVIDPVMVAKNGSALLQLEVIEFLEATLFPLATIITPNIFEAEKLLKTRISSLDDMKVAAQTLGEKYNAHILLKGGHLESNICTDVLYSKSNKELHYFDSERINTKNTHGTGCTLSSAIASYLAQNFDLIEAIKLAKDYLTHAILSGSNFSIGRGFGPVDHFYYLREKCEKKHGVRKNKSSSSTLTEYCPDPSV
jgi:hydroxymethylpyrimidine/phosphomethylpyrimidine kinase